MSDRVDINPDEVIRQGSRIADFSRDAHKAVSGLFGDMGCLAILFMRRVVMLV